MKNVAIAFSGGVDSSFLLYIAHDVLKDQVIAVTVSSCFFPKSETKEASEFTKKHGIKHIVIPIDINTIKDFTMNPINRCYQCKKEVFTKIKEIAFDKGINHIIDGSICDDTNDYRPGVKALEELGIRSPLKEVGLKKKEIRQYLKQRNLQIWDKPSNACLASRFPYGTQISKSKLQIIEKAEEIIQRFDLKQCRVRYHDDIASIEVSEKDFSKILDHKADILSSLKKLGFIYVTLDLQGYRTGSLNEGINNERDTH